MGATHRPFVVNVADLLRRSGTGRDEVLEGALDQLEVVDTRMPAGSPVRIEARLESVGDGVVAKGQVVAPWEGECRRCLKTVTGTLRSDVLEVFEAEPKEGETLLLDGMTIDLEPVAREAVLLDLPLAPLCTEDCEGLCPSCGVDRNEVACKCTPPAADPRWAGLEGLTFDE
ncbi:MAG: DUF177 domain-containing protein [Acidimicrobiales bacterium]